MRRHMLSALAIASMGIAAVGCSDSDSADNRTDEGSASETTTQQPASTTETVAPRSTPVAMGTPSEFAMVLAAPEVAAGRVTLDVVNEGTVEHEVVLIKTDGDSGDLPTDANGAALEDGAVVPHRSGHDQPEEDHHAGVHFATGTSGTVVVDLEPGNYAVVCNLPGHYQAGMHANLKVV